MWNELSTLGDISRNPIFLFTVPLFIGVFYLNANDANWVVDGRTIWPKSSVLLRKCVLGLLHGLSHIIAITLLAKLAYWIVDSKLGLSFWTWGFNLSFLAIAFFLASIVAGTIFGAYLYLTSRFLGTHSNDAFSSLSLDTYKNFVRIRISDEQLTIYPIGMDVVPQRDGWIPNEGDVHSKSAVVPTEPIQYRLIEKPIVID